MNENMKKISTIIENRKLSQFVGLKEDLWFEAKLKDAYNFTSANGRYEFAKDVSAFANSEGGFIIIGLKTDSQVEENADIVSELALFSQVDFDIKKYEAIVIEYVHPKISNFIIEWIEDIDHKGLGLGYIYIPKQQDDKKWFMIKNLIEGKEQIKRIVFGIAKRIGSSNDPVTIEQLYAAIQNGKTPTAERLGKIEDKIDVLLSNVAHANIVLSIDKINDRIKEITDKE